MPDSLMDQLDAAIAAKDAAKQANTAEISEIERVISHLDACYAKGDDCLHPDTGVKVTDAEYDQMRIRLSQLDPQSKIAKSFSEQDSATDKKVQHDPPMVSISKANGTIEEKEDILARWAKTVQDEIFYKEPIEKWASVSFKRDGVALALYYEDGKLISAGLRSRNGVDGLDVTRHMKYVDGVPAQLPIPVTCSIRGELECLISDFEAVNDQMKKDGKKTYANPRNFASGSIQQDDPEEVKDRRLSFVAHSIEGLDGYQKYYKTARERAVWCNKSLEIPFVRVEHFTDGCLAELEKISTDDKLDYEVDGAVIEVSNLEDQEQMGRHGNSITGNPKGKLAWKFSEQRAQVVVKEIVWQVGRTGKVTPVANFDPVPLAGTMVTRCTLHNVGLVLQNKVGIGAIIEIEKSGKIIPYFIQTVKSADKVEYPQVCPDCGGPLVVVQGKDGQELMCQNDNCPAKHILSFLNYLTVMGVKGVGDAQMEALVSKGYVKSIPDLYRLDHAKLVDATGYDRVSLLARAAIHMVKSPEKIKDDKKLQSKIDDAIKVKKKTTLATFIAALGIPGASKGTGRALSEAFGTIDKVRAATTDDFIKVDDIGDKTAPTLFKYFQDNSNMLDDLLQYVEVEIPVVGPLTGQTFVFTGTFDKGRGFWEKELEKLGATISKSVSKKVSVVVIGPDAGSKEDKAKSLGLTMIDLDVLKKDYLNWQDN